MYHLIVSGGTLRVLDSARERLALKCLSSNLAPAHYRVPMIERFAPATRHYGVGRAFIAELSQRDIAELLLHEKCEAMFESRLKFDRQRSLEVGHPADDLSIHGGGPSLTASIAVARYQPLTPTNGIRTHNADLARLLDFLEPRLRIQQLVVLTVLPGDNV